LRASFTTGDVINLPDRHGFATAYTISTTAAVGATPATVSLTLGGKTVTFTGSTQIAAFDGPGTTIFADNTVFLYGTTGTDGLDRR
jgi:hypothetical protein